MEQMYDWQKEAIQAWQNKAFKGIIEAGTGTGKTLVGLEAVKNMKCSTLIVVPSIELMGQWKNNLVKSGCPLELIGELGNGKTDLRKYTIGTFNSVRELRPEGYELMIVDEVHHLPSDKNIHILSIKFKYFLGLTATLSRADQKHLDIIKDYPVVYTYTQKDAVDDGIIAPFKIVPYFVDLTDTEKAQYEIYESRIKALFHRFDFDLPRVIRTATNGLHPNFSEASMLMEAFNKRKEIILNSDERIRKTAELINQYIKYEKIIVFSESIECAEKICALVEGDNKFIYHSKLKKKERKEVYEKFKALTTGVVISCKALEEGVDFPSCKMGIVSGGSSQSRQAIQRIGRFLRRYGDMEAEIFDVVIRGTTDVKWFKKRYSGWK